ncbi:hypothetical protein QQ045_018327 [Rhodiola kirilowii]
MVTHQVGFMKISIIDIHLYGQLLRELLIFLKRWKILRTMPQVEDKIEVSIILATFTLHNIIRMHTLGIPIEPHDEVQGTADADLFGLQQKAQMNGVRDMIATAIMEGIH